MPVAPKDQELNIYSAAFGAGILGALIITIAGAVARAIHLTAWNPEMTLGSIVTQSSGLGTWLLGFLWHLLNGGLFALLYAVGFRALGRSGAVTGLLFGFIHWLIAGLVSGLLPALGLFLFNLGWAPYLGGLLLHLMFGMLVGSVCQASRETRTIEERTEEEYRESA